MYRLYLCLVLYFFAFLSESTAEQVDIYTTNNGYSSYLVMELYPKEHSYYQFPGHFGISPKLTLHKKNLDLVLNTPNIITEDGYLSYIYNKDMHALIEHKIHKNDKLIFEYSICKNSRCEFKSLKLLPKIISQQAFENLGNNINQYLITQSHKPYLVEYKDNQFILEKGAKLQAIIHDRKFIINHELKVKDYATLREIVKISPAILVIDPNTNKSVLYDNVKYVESTKNGSNYLDILYYCLLGFIGGLLINFMPCVLPVLALKFKSFAKQKNCAHLLLQIIGIFSFFIIISLIQYFTILYKQSFIIGEQLANKNILLLVSYFMSFMIILSFGFQSNLINKMSNLNVTYSKTRLLNEFIYGLFSSLLAISCSAPLLGTAVGATLFMHSMTSFIIFMSIATGFSFPLILLLIFPKHLNIAKLNLSPIIQNIAKYLMIIAMFVTYIWIVYLLYIQTTHFITIITVIADVLFIVLLWSRKNIVIRSALIITFLACNIYIFTYKHNQVISVDYKHDKFSEENLTRLLETEHSRVLVNITAEWCITCKFNEWRVFSDPKVKIFLKDNNITLLTGDITKHNPEITNFMKKYNRNSIPLYIAFVPETNPDVLSELISLKKIKNAFEFKTK